MATSLGKIIIQTPIDNAFSTEGTIKINSIYKNENKKSNKNTIVNLSELEKNPTVNLKNYVSYKLERDTIETTIPKDKISILLQYKNVINSFLYDYLSNNNFSDFEQQYNQVSFDVTSVGGGVPLIFKKSSFFTTLAFVLYKKSQNFTQAIFIQNDNVSAISSFYYDNQFLGNSFSYLGATINLYMDKGIAQITIKKDSKGFIESYLIPKIPSVGVYSYQNINNKLLLSLSKNIGDEITKANSLDLFTDEQKNFFKTIIEQKGATYAPDLIYSAGTGNEKYFIIYRLDKRPETYSEIVLDNNIIKKLDIEKLETSITDNIVPNKKYYYCFRTQDIDGTYSDVSLIYEVQIIDQSGTIYMVQNIFKPEKKIEFIKQLNFEDRVRIYPTRAQIKIPEELIYYHEVTEEQKLPPKIPKQAKKSKNAETKKLVGNKTKIIEKTPAFSKEDLVQDDSIFENNKIFKTRIQSRNSKKKFDLNINYTIEIVDGIKLLKDTTITKNFDILKTEELI